MSREKKGQSLSMRIIILTVAKILIQGIGIVTAPIFTRIMSVNDYGMFSIYVSGCEMMAIILGLQGYSTFNNALHDFEKKEYKEYCANILVLSILSFCVGFLLLILGSKFSIFTEVGIQRLFPMMMINAFGVYAVNYAIRYLNAEKDAIRSLLISVFIVLLTSTLSIVLILYADLSGIDGRVWGYCIPYLTFSFFIIFTYIRFFNIRKMKRHWEYCLSISIPLIFHALSAIILGQGDRLVINHVLDEAAAGIYSFCYTIATPISIIWNATNTAWVPEYYDYMEAREYEKLSRKSKIYIQYFSILAGLLMLVSPECVKILATKDYYEGILIIPVVIMGYYFNYLYSFPANYEFYHKKTKYIAGSTLFTAVLNIILNYILIPQLGILGAGIATMLAYGMLFIIHDSIARFVIKGYSYSYRFYLYGILIVIPAFIISIVLLDYFIIRWLIAIFILIVWGIPELRKLKKRTI